MTKAVTQRYAQYIVEIETDPVGAADTFVAMCGIKSLETDRETEFDEVEIPHCDDEEKPDAIEVEPKSQKYAVEGTGIWALSSHLFMYKWWKETQRLRVRVRNKKVEDDGATGDLWYEEGYAYLSKMKNDRTKGERVSAEVALKFDGVPDPTYKA